MAVKVFYLRYNIRQNPEPKAVETCRIGGKGGHCPIDALERYQVRGGEPFCGQSLAHRLVGNAGHLILDLDLGQNRKLRPDPGAEAPQQHCRGQDSQRSGQEELPPLPLPSSAGLRKKSSRKLVKPPPHNLTPLRQDYALTGLSYAFRASTASRIPSLPDS